MAGLIGARNRLARAMLTLLLVFTVVAYVSASPTLPNSTLRPLIKASKPIRDRYIVVFKDLSDVSVDSKTVSKIPGVTLRKHYGTVFKGVAVQLTNSEALQKIRKLTDIVDYVQEDGEATLRDLAVTWGKDRTDQRELPLNGKYKFSGNGTGVNVYVIDSGIYTGNKYFGGRAKIAYDATDEAEGQDIYGHGTHCAGTIGADFYGIAPGVNLWGVKVLGGDYAWSNVYDGMDWVAANFIPPAVASVSLGDYFINELLDTATRGMVQAGIPVSVAVSNTNDDACQYSPDVVREAVTVSSIDHRDYRARYASYGECVDIFAPGNRVLSTFIGHPTATTFMSGNSMAAPHVTGAIAIALEQDPTMTPKQVWEKLKADSTIGVVQNGGPLSPDRLLYIPQASDCEDEDC